MKLKYSMYILSLILLSACGKKTAETKPIRKDVTETVFASGMLEAKGTYSLTAQADGYIMQLNFKEGDVVQKGALLAIIDNKESGINTQSAAKLYDIAVRNTSASSPLLAQAKTSIETAKQKMEQDAVQEERYRKLLAANSIAKVEYENVLLAFNNSKNNYNAALENYRKLQQDANQQVITNKASKEINKVVQGKNQIRAMAKGKVYKKYKEPGDFIRRGDVFAVIGDDNFIYAKINVDESNIGKIKLGQEAMVQLNTNKEKVYKAEVSEIFPSFDEATQSYICKLLFKDSLDFTITNTQLQANIITGIHKNAMLIPRNFIDFGGFIQVKGNKEKIKVKTGFISNEWVQVLAGIDDNAILITDNIEGNNLKTSEAGAQMRH
jgi:HlyD family secretion protein